MTLKLRILGLILLSMLGLFALNYYSDKSLEEANRAYISDSSISTYQNSWSSLMDQEFDSRVLPFDPLDGAEEFIDFWDPEFTDESDGEDLNPLHDSIIQGRVEETQELLEGMFEDALMEDQISFVMVYDRRGMQLFCGAGLYLAGVDPCSASAQPDFFLNFRGFFESLGSDSTRRLIRIQDLEGNAPVSLNDSISFQLKDISGEGIAVVIVGRSVVEGLEDFAENFEVEIAVGMGEEAITSYDYFDEDKPENLEGLIAVGQAHALSEGRYRYSFIDESSLTRVTSVPFSKTERASELRLLIFEDQSALISSLRETQRNAEIGWVLIALIVLLVIFLVTSSAFNRILEAIAVLEKMGSGDLSADLSLKSSFFSSEKDEVGRLVKSIKSYRGLRIEAEEQRVERAKRRTERDEIMFEKMALLADELEGSARALLIEEISEMQNELNAGSEEAREKASIEMMSRAFSRMSDEVVALISARTSELVEARDEISSSIRYAARLQNALLPKSYPGDITMRVEWRPRDLVGGDIYFVKDFPDRVYIAVVDCTGHGVPGAFLSIIARSALDKAIDIQNYQSAGKYLTTANSLLKETLARADQSNRNEEGFDGGVCIYYRKEGMLEFAGAKASIFNVTEESASEISGDRKSVGSTRIADNFEFQTHHLSKPKGAFVMLTDGITDVMNGEEKPIAFGRRRVLRILRESVNITPKNLVDNIMTSVDLYRGGAPLRDDLTLLAFSINDDEDAAEEKLKENEMVSEL
ncbi:MAG: SpoIIE family protein phosphatase [Betaproteobacteria bacterium]|jgi:serine phosphatase RsbU (regulator of sigma subunit)